MALSASTDPTAADSDDEPTAEQLQAVQAELGEVADLTHLGGVQLPDEPTNRHGCPGQIEAWIYQGSDGHTHVAVSIWYSCESHLEILSDVAVP